MSVILASDLIDLHEASRLAGIANEDYLDLVRLGLAPDFVCTDENTQVGYLSETAVLEWLVRARVPIPSSTPPAVQGSARVAFEDLPQAMQARIMGPAKFRTMRA